MDTDQMSCANCGHTLSASAVTCAYCGTAVASADSPPQPDEKSPDPVVQAAEQPEVSSDDAPPVLDTTEAPSGTPEVTPDAGPSAQLQPEETRQVINESAAEVASGNVDSVPKADDKVDFQLPDDELIVEFDGDEPAKAPDLPSAAGAGSAVTHKPETESGMNDVVDLNQQAAEGTAEVIPLTQKASAKTVPETTSDLPQTPVLEENAEDASESETLGADIRDLVEDEPIEPQPTQNQLSRDSTPTDTAAVAKKAEKTSGLPPDAGGTENEELDAIMLKSDEEVQAETPSSPADPEQAVKMPEIKGPVELAAPTVESTAKPDDSSVSDDANAKADAVQKQTEAQASRQAAKIEKASQGSAQGRKVPKAGPDDKAAMNKKAALAKAQALKKKKLQLAKAQVLKRKKLALAKAQALKKQKDARAVSAKAGKAAATGANMVKTMAANTQLLSLLKKYEGQTIGINFDNSADIKEAELVTANAEFFSVFVKDQELTYCHPLKTILTVIEGKDGVGAGNPDQKTKFNAVVKVYPLVLF